MKSMKIVKFRKTPKRRFRGTPNIYQTSSHEKAESIIRPVYAHASLNLSFRDTAGATSKHQMWVPALQILRFYGQARQLFLGLQLPSCFQN